MNQLPTILINGYDTDISWVDLAWEALVGITNQLRQPRNHHLVIQGQSNRPVFHITLKPIDELLTNFCSQYIQIHSTLAA